MSLEVLRSPSIENTTILQLCAWVEERADRNKNSQTVRAVDHEETEDTEYDEIYSISDIAAVQLDDSQLVTLKQKPGNFLRFQPDTGAQCNVIHLYKKATKDVGLEHVKQYQTAIVAYGGSKIPVVGEVQIHVSRGDYQCLLDCKLVDSTEIRPHLAAPGKKSVYWNEKRVLEWKS